MNHELSELLTIVWAVGFGLLAQILAHRWRIPAIVLLLFCGIVLGPSALAIVNPADLGDSLAILVKLAVAIILFEGALNLRLPLLRTSARELRNLVTVGMLITWGLTALIAHYIAQLEWSLAILFGALMTVTGPTVVQPLLKRINLSRKIKNILEGEAILIDPVGAILAVAVLDVILGLSANHAIGIVSGLWSYLGRLVIGLIVGGGMALAIARLMKIPRLIPAELSNLVVLASLWVSFGLAEWLQSESGIMSSVAMGLVLQRAAVPGGRQLRLFKESLTTLSISVVFVLLAANLEVVNLLGEGKQGVLAILLIMFAVRPISVFLSTWRTTLNWREKILIAWIGPRGIVAASVASLFGLTLTAAGFPDGDRLPALTFLAIIMTVTIQGLTASSLAQMLKLHSMEGRKVVIVGANRLGLSVAGILRDHGRPVVLVDTNQILVATAQHAGFEAILGNALEEEVLEQAGITEAETIVAITSNSEVNVLVSQVATEVFGIKRAFPVLNNPEKGAGPKLLIQTGGRLGLGRAIDFRSWEYADEQRIIWQVPVTWAKALASAVPLSDDLLPVIRMRGKSADVVHAEQDWQPKDRIVCLSRIPPEQAQDFLRRKHKIAG